MLTCFLHNYCVDSLYIHLYMLYAILILDTCLTQWLSLFASYSCHHCIHQTKVAYFSKASALSWNMSSQRKWQAFMAKVSSISAIRKDAWIWFACQVLAIFFDNSWRTFNASSCISSRMKLLEYHASFWHRNASHLMVCWLLSSH